MPTKDKEMAKLERQVDKLEEMAKAARRELNALMAKRGLPSFAKKRLKPRLKRVPLGGECYATTVKGSLYSTILQAMAKLGRLKDHDEIFADFSANRVHYTKCENEHLIHEMVDKMAVDRLKLEGAVRSNAAFQAHCVRQTQLLTDAATDGHEKAKKILANPNICKGGKWYGDIDEALSILSQGFTPSNLERRNLKILKNCHPQLLFHARVVDGEVRYFLYPAKHHVAYKWLTSADRRISR